MNAMITIKTLIAVASAASLIAMAFLSMTPAGWFLGFCSAPLVWLFGEGVVKSGLNLVRGKSLDNKE